MSTAEVRSPAVLALLMLTATVALCLAGVAFGNLGLEPLWGQAGSASAAIVWDIRLPRTLGAWVAGALLGLAGAIAQGLFRNPLADPYLLGSATGAALGVALLLVAIGSSSAAASGWAARLGLSAAGFAGAVIAVLVTLALAKGVQNTLRLLLAGVVAGMVFGALTATAASLGIALTPVRITLIGAMALATGTAVAQVGLVAFIGLVAHGAGDGQVQAPLAAATGRACRWRLAAGRGRSGKGVTGAAGIAGGRAYGGTRRRISALADASEVDMSGAALVARASARAARTTLNVLHEITTGLGQSTGIQHAIGDPQ